MEAANGNYSGDSFSAEITEICCLRSITPSLWGNELQKVTLKTRSHRKCRKGKTFLVLSSRKQFCQQPLQLRHLQKWVFPRQSRCSKVGSFVNIDEKCELKMWPHSVSYLRVTAIRTLNIFGAENAKIFFQSKYITAENIFSRSKITLTVACHHTVAKGASLNFEAVRQTWLILHLY